MFVVNVTKQKLNKSSEDEAIFCYQISMRTFTIIVGSRPRTMSWYEIQPRSKGQVLGVFNFVYICLFILFVYFLWRSQLLRGFLHIRNTHFCLLIAMTFLSCLLAKRVWADIEHAIPAMLRLTTLCPCI